MFRAAIAALLIFAAPVFADERTDDPLANLLAQFGEHAGKINACSQNGMSNEISELAGRIAAKRFDSLWDRFSGARSKYAKEVRDRANSRYISTVLKPCEDSITISTSRLIVSTARQSILQNTPTP